MSKGEDEFSGSDCELVFHCKDESNCVYAKSNPCVLMEKVECRSSIANVNAMVLELKKLGFETVVV